MVLHPTPVSTRQFTLDGATFVAEISDFGPGFKFGQVYDDACDEGITLVSQWTGAEIVFAVHHEERRDGDLLWWELRAVRLHAEPGRQQVF